MKTPFSDFLRRCGSLAVPDAELWSALHAAVWRHLARRGLRSAPPRYLGYGHAKWRMDDDFEDLVLDCYQYAFIQRFRRLREHAATKPNVEGLIHRNIEHFFTERQQRYDPAGYAAYVNARNAVNDAMHAGLLHAAAVGKRGVTNSTVLSFAGTSGSAMPTTAESIREALHGVEGWKKLLPRLAQCGRGPKGDDPVGAWRLAWLDALRVAGIKRFYFKDLVDSVKAEVRPLWYSQHAHPGGPVAWEDGDASKPGAGAWVPLLGPDDGFDERDAWEHLVDEIAREIARVKQKRVRDRVQNIFRELVDAVRRGENAPSQAELARRLGVPTSSIHDGCKLLREITARRQAEKPG